MTDWQQVISTAAVQQFATSGRLGTFRLARRDLLALAGQVMKQDAKAQPVSVDEVDGFIALRCVVHCAPLGYGVTVDEWQKGLPST